MKILLLIGCCAALVAACGSESDAGSGEGGQSRRQRALDGALAFAKCMRENGVDMPDPRSNGNGLVQIGPAPGEGGDLPNPDDPAFRRADEKCRKHLDAGAPAPDDAVLEEHRD